MTQYTNNYTWLMAKFGKVMESHQELGKTLREAGPINDKDANLIQLAAAAATKMDDIENKTDLTPVQKEEFEARLHRASHESRVPCASALAIAKSLGIPAADVGKIADKLNIRIEKCRLGCF
jgi:LAO/AO transport system kinase